MPRPLNFNLLPPPCYNRKTKTGCPDRHEACHATCEKWADYVKLRDATYEERIKRKQAVVDQVSYAVDLHYKFVRHNRNHKR